MYWGGGKLTGVRSIIAPCIAQWCRPGGEGFGAQIPNRGIRLGMGRSAPQRLRRPLGYQRQWGDSSPPPPPIRFRIGRRRSRDMTTYAGWLVQARMAGGFLPPAAGEPGLDYRPPSMGMEDRTRHGSFLHPNRRSGLWVGGNSALLVPPDVVLRTSLIREVKGNWEILDV